MEITYDREAEAAYVYLHDKQSCRTKHHRTQNFNDRVLLDLDEDGNVLGVELLFVTEPTVQDITRKRG